MKAIKVEQIFNFNNNNKSNNEIISHELSPYMQNQRNTDNWYSDALSATIVDIIERHEQINERLQTTSIADILAEIQFDNKSKDRTPLKEKNVCRNLNTDGLTNFDLTLIEPPNPHPHLTKGKNKTTNAFYEDGKGDAKVWKETSVFYNNPFDPRITFKGLHLHETTKNKITVINDPLTGYPDTFNSFLDIVNPSGFANSYLHTYQQYLKDLRNESRQLAQDNPFKISDRQGENKIFDKIESELHSNDDKVHDAPCYVGNECENIDMWSQITATRRFWLEDDKRQKSTNINDDNSTKSLLVALFSNSTEDLLSNPSNQAENELDVNERSGTGNNHLQPDVPKQRSSINERQSRSAPQSRILSHILNLQNDSDPETTQQVLPNIQNQVDAHSEHFTTDDNNRITSSNGLVDSLAGCEDIHTNSATTEETIWAPNETGEFMGTSFVPPFNPWSTVHVDYLDKPVVAAQTSMFWSHQQRCRQQQQQQQQQQNHQESLSHADKVSSYQNKQERQEQQDIQHQSLTDQQQDLDYHGQQQQQLKEEDQQQQHYQQQLNQQQYQVQEIYLYHNEQHNPQQLQHHPLFQNQYQNQHEPVFQTQIHKHQLGQKHQQQLEQQSMHTERLSLQQQLDHQQQSQQQHLQNNYRQTHQYNPQTHPVNQMPPVYQQHHQPPPQTLPQQQHQQQKQIHLYPSHGLFNQQCSVQNQRNKIKHVDVQCSQEQWSGSRENFRHERVSGGYTFANGCQPNSLQHSVNVQQPPNYIQNSGRSVYQTNVYYPGVYPRYSTSSSMDGGQYSTNHVINGNSAYRYTSGAVANLNFIHSTAPQHNYVQFDDEVWYINGIPHQHAKPVQSNENVELPLNKHYWPQMFGQMPNVAPPSYASAQSYQGMSANEPDLIVKSNNQQNSFNNNRFQNACPNNNKNNNAEVDDSMYNSSKDGCTSTDLDVGSEIWSIDSVGSSRSQNGLFRISDDITELSRDCYKSATPDSLSEFSDAEGEEDWFDNDEARDNLEFGGISNDFQDDLVSDGYGFSKITKTGEFVGRQIKVLSGRSKANRERHFPPRKLRYNRASHLIKII